MEQLDIKNRTDHIDTTLFIVAYPKKHVDIGGKPFTIFNLGFPNYKVGSPGSPGSPPSTDFDITTGTATFSTESPGSPSTPASLFFKKITTKFLLESKVPIFNQWEILFLRKKPFLYLFSGELTSEYLGVDLDESYSGRFTRLAELNRFESTTNLDTMRIVTQRKRELKNKFSSALRPPKFPTHLSDLEGLVFFIAREKYSLGDMFGTVPGNLSLEYDFNSTLKLYSKIISNELDTLYFLQNSEILRLISWLRSSPVNQEAITFMNGNETPFFIAWDKKDLIQSKRNHKAIELFEKAVEIDPLWNEPKRNLNDAKNRLNDSSDYGKISPPMGKRVKVGIKTSFFSPSKTDSPDYFEVNIKNKFFKRIISLSPFIKYQLSQNISGIVSWDLYKSKLNEYFTSIVDNRGSITFNYQTPFRIQLSNLGTRVQIMIGFKKLSEIVNIDSDTFSGNGTAYEFGIGLIKRDAFHFSSPNSKIFNPTLDISLLYRLGYFGNFTSIIDGHKAILSSPESSKPMTINMSGIFLNLNINLFNF